MATLGDLLRREAEDATAPITVWPFYDAPLELRALSDHGGDEDWLALVPARFRFNMPAWLESGTRFGVCDVSEHVLQDGRIVCIGAHS